MPTVRKTSPGRVTIHDIGTFARGDEREVGHDSAEYLVDERGDFERVGVDKDGATDVEDKETDSDGSEGGSDTTSELVDANDKSDKLLIDAGVCPWCGEEFDGVAQHASSAHPEEYADYKEADSE